MKRQPELTVEEVPTESLIPYARNAKIHTNEQIDQICESIGEFGFNDPVAVWDGPDGPEIIEGHGRVMAAKRLGLEVVPVVRLDHLTDEQRRAYGIVHNKLTMNTGWDFAKLEQELDGLAGWDMGAFGFDGMLDDDGEIDMKLDAGVVEGEEEFASAIDMRHEYIVLMFETEEDFDWASQALGVKRANQLNVGSKPTYSKGRVIDGVKALMRYAEAD